MSDAVRHIRIGIAGSHPAWELLLDQIGVPWSILQFESDLFSRYSLIIVPSRVGSDELRQIREYSLRGGCVLYNDKEYFPSSRTTVLKTVYPGNAALYRIDDVLDIGIPCAVFEHGYPVHAEHNGNGLNAYLGINLVQAYSILSSQRKNFSSQFRPFPHEVVSAVSKNALRQMVTSLIERLHHHTGLPFVHAWYFPGNTPSIFTFRIDTDKGSKDDIAELKALSEKHAIPTSWFLDVKSHEGWLEYFSEFRGQEIGVHCYEHVLYPSPLLNKENFSKARELVQRHIGHPAGITSPTGAWNPDFARLISEMDFAYSSEFSYDYDNFPSHPFSEDEKFSTLQIPIHPICIGSMLRAHYTTSQMTEYFKSVIDKKIALREPVCLYHHPTHRHNEVFDSVFHYINELKIPKLSYSQFAAWWSKRNSFDIRCTVDGDTLFFSTDGQEQDHHVRISLQDSRETILPGEGKIVLSDLKVVQQREVPINDADYKGLRNFDYRHPIQNMLDWWIKVTE